MNIDRLEKKVNYIIDFLEKKFNIKNINRSEFIKDIYYLNKLIHQFYLIVKSDKSDNEKIEKLVSQKTPDGKAIFSKDIAEMVLKKYGSGIVEFYDTIYNYRLNSKNIIKSGGSQSMLAQNIGIDVNKDILKNYLKKDITKSSINTIGKNIKTTSEILGSQITNLGSNISNIDINNIVPKHITQIGTLMINWIFFPLWSMENLPIVGSFIEIPLDIMGLIIDNFDIMMENMGSSVTMLIDILLDVLQAIPVAGAVVSAITLPLNFLEQPIEYAVENGTDLIGMFYNLSRKQWGLAYVSSLSAIPYWTDIVDAIVTNLVTANKFLSKINNGLGKISGLAEKADGIILNITKNAKTYSTAFNSLLSNPEVFYSPELFVSKLIVPMKNNINFLKDISDEKIISMSKQFQPILKKFINDPFKYVKDPIKIYDDIIEPYKESIPLLKDLSKDEIVEKIYEILGKIVGNVNYQVEKYTNNLTDMRNKKLKATQ